MVEALVAVLVLSFLTLIFGIAGRSLQIIIPQVLLLCVVIYLLVRVRLKMARREKENLRKKIDDLEEKIKSFTKETD